MRTSEAVCMTITVMCIIFALILGWLQRGFERRDAMIQNIANGRAYFSDGVYTEYTKEDLESRK